MTPWIVVGIVVAFLCVCAGLYWYGYQSPKAIEHLRHSRAYPLGYSDDSNGDASYVRVLLFPALGVFFLVAGAGLTVVRLVRGTLWQDRAAPEPREQPGLLHRLYGHRL